eukprot:UN06721
MIMTVIIIVIVKMIKVTLILYMMINKVKYIIHINNNNLCILNHIRIHILKCHIFNIQWHIKVTHKIGYHKIKIKYNIQDQRQLKLVNLLFVQLFHKLMIN